MRSFDTFPRRQRLIPRNTWSPDRFRGPLHYSTLPDGNWETVQPSAQKVDSGDRYMRPSFNTSRLNRQFSELGFEDDLQDGRFIGRHKRYDNDHHGYVVPSSEKSEDLFPNYSRGSIHSDSLSKSVPSRRVVHDARDRLIQIPVEHVSTIPRSKPQFDFNSNRHSTMYEPDREYCGQNGTWRKNSCEMIDISDEDTDEFEESSSDASDCDIYPFTLRNTNNNVKRRKSRGRSQPYSISKSTSPEIDRKIASHSRRTNSIPSTSYLTNPAASNIRTKNITTNEDDDLVYISDDDVRCRSTREYAHKTLPHSRHHQEKEPYLKSHGSTSLNGCTSSPQDIHVLKKDQFSTRSSSRSDKRFDDRYLIIEDDKDSAFSNNGYRFCDKDGVISVDDVKYGNILTREKENVNSRKNYDSGGGIVETPSYPAYNIIRDMIQPEERQVDYIRGDGNCLFRALSKVIYNTESCYEELRQAVVDLMEKFPKDFEQFIDEKSFYSHIVYMRKDGTWGTQAEIYGAATLLQRDIYILSPDPTGKQYRWLLFSPRFKLSDVDSYDSCYITLCHTNGNHYDRIAPLIGKCNCHLLPPQLSGVKEKVDLTNVSEEDLLV